MDNRPFWEQQLEEIYQFARLHHWVNQLNELIEGFADDFSQNHEQISHRIHSRHLSLQQDPTDNLVSLVLLHKFQTPVLETTEKLFYLLHGKLDSKDQQFLIHHFFKGTLPLSTNDSHEIIIRSFISYKRALYHGMQIENLVSNVNPEETALFFTVLICRVDVHPQNRALINLLLYRIEARLPENVLQGVLAYLKKLRQVLYEVYTRGEQVLSDELNISDEPDLLQIEENSSIDTASGYEPDEEPPRDLSLSEKSSALTASGNTGLEASADYAGGWTAGEEPGGMENPRETSVESPNRGMTADQRQGEPSRGQGNIRQKDGFAAASFIQNKESLHQNGSADNRSVSGDFNGLTGSESGRASGALEGAVLSEPENSGNNIFQVAFNRSIEKLLDLLGDDDELPAEEDSLIADITGDETDGGTGKGDIEKPNAHGAELKRGMSAASGPAKTERLKRFGVGILISLAAVVLLSAVLFFAAGQRNTSEPVAAAPDPVPAVTVPYTEPKPVLPEIVSDVRQLTGEHTSSATSEDTGGNSINPDIKVEDGTFLWRVKEGESVWKMYVFARGGSGLYSLPVDVSWSAFLEMFRNLNPMLLNPDVIYPDNLLRLPGDDLISADRGE